MGNDTLPYKKHGGQVCLQRIQWYHKRRQKYKNIMKQTDDLHKMTKYITWHLGPIEILKG